MFCFIFSVIVFFSYSFENVGFSKIIQFEGQSFDAISAYIIVGSLKYHFLRNVPVFFKEDNNLRLSSLGKLANPDQEKLSIKQYELEAHLAQRNYFVETFNLNFINKRIENMPYLIVNISHDDTGLLESINKSLTNIQFKATKTEYK